jgi:uncharacterized membrane protein YedE/YeeE
MRYLIAYFSGIIFSAGLVIGGMTQPKKIVQFLDFAGNWDPSLAFVMGGAVLVTAVAFPFIQKRETPLVEDKFHLPSRSDIDWELVVGGGLFGVGWGLGGYCPGPALTGMVSGATMPIVFVVSMSVGMYLYRFLDKAMSSSSAPPNRISA